MEPQWTKAIPSEYICNTYYALFIFYAIIAVLAILASIGLFTMMKTSVGVLMGIQGILTALIGGTLALFMYLMCDRALLSNKKQEKPQALMQ